MAYQFPAAMTAQQRNRIVDAFCAYYGYPSVPIDGTNVTGNGTNADRTRFFQLQVKQFIHGVNRSQRGEVARSVGAAEADADGNLLD